MNSTTALPPKAAKVKCTRCHLVSPATMIVKTHEYRGDPRGRCKDRKACEVRQLRAKNKAKEAKS